MTKHGSVAKLMEDADKIKKCATRLDKALSKGDDIRYIRGVSLLLKGNATITILKKAAVHARRTMNFSEADGEMVMSKIEESIPYATSALEKITKLQARADMFNVTKIVLFFLKQMEQAQFNFASALVENTPSAAWTARAEAIRTTVDAAFTGAIAAYSGK